MDALTGQDPPIEKAHPGLQPSLVFMSYPIVLVISVIAILSWYWLSAPNAKDKGPAEPTINRSTTDAEATSREPNQ